MPSFAIGRPCREEDRAFVDRRGQFGPRGRRGGGHFLQLAGLALALLGIWSLIFWQAVDHAKRRTPEDRLPSYNFSGRGGAL